MVAILAHLICLLMVNSEMVSLEADCFFIFFSGSSPPQEVPKDSFEDDRNLTDADTFEAADDDENSEDKNGMQPLTKMLKNAQVPLKRYK